MPLATRRAKRALLALGLRPSACKPSRPVSGRGQGRQPPKAGARSASLEPGRAPVYSAQLLSPQAGRGGQTSAPLQLKAIVGRNNRSASVTFEPGARTAWHTHPLGQTLIVTFGTGWVQRRAGPVEEIRPGDVVWFAPGEKHW